MKAVSGRPFCRHGIYMWNSKDGNDERGMGMRRKLSVLSGLMLFPAAFLYYEILFKWFGGIGPGDVGTMLLFVLASGGLLQAIYLLLPGRRLRFCYTVFVLVATAILFLIEYFVGRAFQTFMTFDSLLTGAGDAAGDFGSTIVRTVVHGWFVILVFMLPAVLVYGFRDSLIASQRSLIHASAVTVLFSIFCFLAGNLAAGMQPVYQEGYQFDLSARTFGLLTTMRMETARSIFPGGKEEDTFTVADMGEQQKENGTDPNQSVLDVNAYGKNLHVRNEMDLDFEALAAAEEDSSLKNLDLFLASQTGSSCNEYTGLFQGKNLILICAEAFSPYAVSEELTPTLYRLMHKGFYFSDYYQPAWGGSTSTGEYSVLMGLIPTEGVKSIRKTVGHNLYLTIGNQLSRLGYYSAAYHDNSYTYYGRNETHINLGYDTFMGMGNGMEKGVSNCWPQSDSEMMDFTVSQYLDRQPFNIYYMTVSGHCGYSSAGNAMSAKNWDAVQQVNASDTVKAYLASQLELEYAMESLVSQLEQAGIMDDTVICLTADHYPYGLEKGDTWGNDSNYLPELYGCDEDELDKFVQDQNAWILWSGCLENDQAHMVKEISEPVYSLDILPTLSNLFGIEYDSRLLAGRDVFSEEEPLVIWSDYSWKTDKASYNAVNGKVTWAEGKAASGEYLSAIKAKVKNKFNLSRMTLNYDYWGKLFP